MTPESISYPLFLMINISKLPLFHMLFISVVYGWIVCVTECVILFLVVSIESTTDSTTTS